ncbi:penicillin-binding protein [Desulfobacca acetoxidans]|uniref:Peptidoglycan glycosyltransferase n=1 Tax=Desulfobacca acetoxidans (strain ATCC 700848 / DSM 11109 / ASRB2) TaxID=880072 RepID=F2NG76_DESAR|nr:penicillin-binding protein [Desulfobacca acetoxidans]AEB08489.1 Peptidoglycan glycosyltransferase [Desulfobacca acetoxidans DSM 11109]
MLGKWIRVRIILVGLGLGIFFLAVFCRIVELKFIRGPALEEMAVREHEKHCPVLPIRGSIMDRNQAELAISTFVKSLGAHPRRLTEKKLLSRKLAPLIGIPAPQLLELLARDRPFIWVKRHLTPQQTEAVENFKANYEKINLGQEKNIDSKDASLDAMYLIPEARRYYPHQSLAGPILGFCDIDGRGLEGLERQFDEYIYGKPQKCINILDARGHIVISSEKELIDDTMGDNIILSIDRTIQYIAEKELQQGVNKWHAAGGYVVVAAPQTGEILAMAQIPGFDPNHYFQYTKEHYQNRNVTMALEPGSTFKIFTVAAALDAKVVKPMDKFHCENGAYSLGACGVIHDVHPYGGLTVSEIIKKSSNIGAAKIGLKLGPHRTAHYLKGFGFGQRTGICYSGENYGLVRNITSCRSLIDRVTVSFGQGITITPLQMTMALAALGNDGILMQPLLVKKIIDHKGETVKNFHPTAVRQVLSPQTAKTMLDMMKTATEPGGTGTEAVPPGYTVAGKTGTAQKVVGRAFSKSKYNSLFVGLTPAENPVLAIVVVIDEPKGAIYGGVVAAPIFREIAAQSLRFLGYYPQQHPPTTPTSPPLKSPKPPLKETPTPTPEPLPTVQASLTSIPLETDSLQQMPNFKGMTIRQVISLLNRAGMRYRIEGRGFAVEQRPAPGEPLPSDKFCWVKFKPQS